MNWKKIAIKCNEKDDIYLFIYGEWEKITEMV